MLAHRPEELLTLLVACLRRTFGDDQVELRCAKQVLSPRR